MEVTITYETLFEMLRREKDRSELQELGEDFYKDVGGYLKDKSTIIATSSHADQLQHQIQLENTKRILRDLYSRREAKILQMALIEVKTGSPVVLDSLLNSEKKLYESMVRELKTKREETLSLLLQGKKIKEPAQPTEAIEKVEKKIDTDDNQLIRFLKDVPEFVGENLTHYGPFKQNDLASIPQRLAEILISKDAAEIISTQP